jgi:hypothetical protein
MTSLQPLLRTLSLSNILVIWATLLQEGKVVLQCAHTALLTPVCEGLLQLLFPLEWQGMYIPVLPVASSNHTSMDILEAPVPYLVGLAIEEETLLYQPRDVLWCDLDTDVLHLGYNPDGSFVETLPTLPDKAMLRLKVQLEEFADLLYLPSMEGIKGQMTTGDRSCRLDNALREPYALRTKLFDRPSTQAFSRSYILSQSSKVPPRGRTVQTKDFVITREEPSGYGDLFCCFAETSQPDISPEEAEKENDGTVDNVKELDTAKSGNNSTTTSAIVTSFALSSRQMQAQTDRLMALFVRQEYATPSSHASKATRDQQFTKDALKRQDEIAALFFETNQSDLEIAEQVRKCILTFFVSFLSRYEFYVDSKTGRLDTDRLLCSLRLPREQQAFVKAMLSSQMFDVFFHNPSRRRSFDHFILEQQRRGEHIKVNDSRLSVVTLTVQPPCGVGIVDGVVHFQDRRFPDALNEKELIVTKPTTSIWGSFCGGVGSAPLSSPRQSGSVLHHTSPRSSHHGSPWWFSPGWIVSVLFVVMFCGHLPSNVDALATYSRKNILVPRKHWPAPTRQMYKPFTADDEPSIPTNNTITSISMDLPSNMPHAPIDYDFTQESLTVKKFNTDLHDVTFKESPLKGLRLLQAMETLYEESPYNSSLVQPNSYSYATVIEGCCQTRRGEHSDQALKSDNVDSAVYAAQELLDKMEADERLVPTALTYLYVCQKWAEECAYLISPVTAMQNAEKVFDAYKRQMMREKQDVPPARSMYPSSNLASFHAVIVDGWSKLVGIVPNAMDRAEMALQNMEQTCAVNKDQAVPANMQEATRAVEGAQQSMGPYSLAYSSFIVGMSRSKQHNMAQKADKILERMKKNAAQPDMVVYTSVLNCWANTVSREEQHMASSRAISLLQEMEDAYFAEKNYLLKPSQTTYSQAIKAIRHSLDPNAPVMAESILKRMYSLTESGLIQVPPNAVNYNAVIMALSSGGQEKERRSNAQRAEALLVEMVRRSRHEGEFSVEPNIFTWGSVLRAWAESGSPDAGEQAQRVLDKFEQLYDSGNSRIRPNVVCYTTVIQAWARGDASPEVALQHVNELLTRLEESYVESGKDYLRPNEVTYITIMDAYSRKCPEKAGSMCQSLVEHVLQLHEKRPGFQKPTRSVFNALINAWSRSGEENAAEHAEEVFRLMESQGDRMAGGAHGVAIDRSTQPDEVSICGVLNAWANNAMNGGALRAQQILEHSTNNLTTEERGFEHSIVSWNILIKAWGRSRAEDSVQRAERILLDLEENFGKGKSPIKPDITTYSSVINCCAYYCGPSKDKSIAFEVAWRTFTKLKQSNNLVVNNIVYGTLFKAIGKLRRADRKRDGMIQDLFDECCHGGQVCMFVLAQVRSASPKKLFRQLVLTPCALTDRDASNIDKIFRAMPKSWHKNVAHAS